MSSSRKAKRNLGVVENEGKLLASDLTPKKDAVAMVERIIRTLLVESVDQLKDDEPELRRFFEHFYDATIDQDEIDEFITNFMAQPPKTKLGYPRSGAEIPLFAVVNTEDEESDEFVGQFMGQDGDTDHVGSFYESVFTIYVLGGHPIQVGYLYQFAKAVITSGKIFLFSCGALTVHLSGGELAPDEDYMPENMYVRVLRVKVKAPYTAPRFKLADPAKIRITGIFMDDVVVDGQKGGMTGIPFTTEESDD